MIQKSKEISRKESSLDDVMYILGLGVIILGMLSVMIEQVIPDKWNVFHIPCLFHEITGYYCAGCGGRRAFEYLLRGNIFKSIYFHPVVAYGIFVFAWYMISQTLERAKIGKVKAIPYKNLYVYIGLVITVINVIIKNMAFLVWNIKLIP